MIENLITLRMNRYILIVLGIVVLAFPLTSQELDIPLLGWESHLPYQTGKWVTQSEQTIYFAAEQSLLLINKEDLSVRFFSKVDGLSDTGIEIIEYDYYNNQLVIVYSNSNIDILNDDGLLNIPDIKENTTIIGSRKINDIQILNPEILMLSTAFGMVEYRLKKQEFGSTIFTNLPILQVANRGDKIYAASEDGIYTIDQSQNSNIADFNRWHLLGEENNLPLLYEAFSVVNHKDYIYFTDGKSIYRAQEDNLFSHFYTEEDLNFSFNYLSSGNKYLMAGLRAPQASRILYWEGSNKIEGSRSCIDRLIYSIEDEKGQIWFADNFRNFRFTAQPLGGCQRLTFDSPLTENGSDIAIHEEKIAIASGGVTDNFNDLFSRDGFYLYQNQEWKNVNESFFQPMKDNDFLNQFKVNFSPMGDKLLIGSFWNGLMEYDLENQTAVVYNQDNSALQGAIGDGRARISDMEYDSEGNLWMSNFNAPNPLVVKDPENNWFSFSTNSDRRVGDIAIDDFGNIWITTFGTSGGLFVYNPGADLSSTSDDQKRTINLNNSEISSSIVYTVASDLDGNVWVGTAEGAVVFDCGANIFNSQECIGFRPTVIVDSIPAFLLETEEVRCIAFDGANRKWFGTRNGIFIQSKEGDKEVARFTIDNSPLFDNEVVDMAFDEENGFMYISTNKGLQSLRTETTTGSRRHSNQVYAYPNPVTPEYAGPIAIKGLARDAIVKITDLQGRLVYETRALGGQAIWEGQSLDGAKAETGVYLVFSTGTNSFTQPDNYVTKILFVAE